VAQVFTDPTLQQLIATAIANNYDMRLAANQRHLGARPRQHAAEVATDSARADDCNPRQGS